MVGYLVFITISTSLFALFALGLNLQWGFTGLINFGHVAFMTVGAYTTVILSSKGMPLPLAIFFGAAIASVLGLLIGFFTLRLREDYLSIVTIGISELLRLIALNEEWLTQGAFGIQRYPLPLAGFEPNLIGKIILIGLLTLLAIFATWQLWKGLRSQERENKKTKKNSYQPNKLINIINWVVIGLRLVLTVAPWQLRDIRDRLRSQERESQKIQENIYQQTKLMGLVIWGVIGLALILTVYINSCIALLDYTYKAGLMLLILLTLALVYWGLQVLVKSPWGRILKAIREDEEIPRALGKNVFWYKLQAFMLGGAIAGIAGAFYAWQLTTVYPSNFEPLVTFNAWTMVVLGGAGNNAGAVLGAIIFWAYDALTRQYLPRLGLLDGSQLGPFRMMIIGLILMLLMIWRPQGLLGKKEELTLGK